MPSDAKSSPWFHEVSPETVPLHSFCQTLFPTFNASLCEIVIARASSGQNGISPMATSANRQTARPNL
jgi:hypothetical protein